MASVVDVWNQALAHVAASRDVQSVTDATKEALACSRFWATARDTVLRVFPWPFARRTVTLALVTDFTSVDGAKWTYAYRAPGDLLAVRRVPNGVSRRETNGTRISYELGGDDSGGLLYTDLGDATLEYTARVEDPDRWPPDVVLAVSLLLAFLIAPTVTGGDQFKLGARAGAAYQAMIAQAKVTAANEDVPDQPLAPELERAREGVEWW